MSRVFLPFLLIVAAVVSGACAETTIVFSSQKYIREKQDDAAPTSLSGTGYTSFMSTLLGLDSDALVDFTTSQQIDAIARPSAFDRPQALLTLRVMGPQDEYDWKEYLGEESAHVARLAAGAEAVNAVLSRAASNVAVHYWPLAKMTTAACDDACMEELFATSLEALGGNYTAGSEAWAGVASIPTASGEGVVSIPLEDAASRLWAEEMATLHGAAQQLEEKSSEAHPDSILYEGTIASPELIGAVRGTDSPQAQAATMALSTAVRCLHKTLMHLHPDELVTHVVFLNGLPDFGNGQLSQRRRLLAASIGAADASETAANSWFVGAAAWISALLFLVFAIASAQILATMDFKQDSLLYSRAKTE